MNNDTPQPDTPFHAQPNQPAPRFGSERKIVQPIDPRRSVDSIQSPRPAQPMPERPNPSPAYSQPQQPQATGYPAQPMSPISQAPQQPVRDPSYAAQPMQNNSPVPQQPNPNPAYTQQPVNYDQQPQQPQATGYPAQPMSPINQAPSQPAPNANPVYPHPTSGRSADPIPVPVPNNYAPVKADKKTQTVTTLVMVFGAFMVVMSALSIISWLSVGLKGPSEILGSILALVGLVLGIGILLKREMARFAYVILAAVMLVFSIIGTVSYISAQSSNNTSNSAQMVGLRSAIQKYENDNSLTAAQKSKYIQVLEKSETVVQKQQSNINEAGKVQIPFLNILEEYVIAILPIVFLTRPSVKKVFS